MAETPFWSLSRAEQIEAVSLATRRSQRAGYLLEKDIWLVTVLELMDACADLERRANSR